MEHAAFSTFFFYAADGDAAGQAAEDGGDGDAGAAGGEAGAGEGKGGGSAGGMDVDGEAEATTAGAVPSLTDDRWPVQEEQAEAVGAVASEDLGAGRQGLKQEAGLAGGVGLEGLPVASPGRRRRRVGEAGRSLG